MILSLRSCWGGGEKRGGSRARELRIEKRRGGERSLFLSRLRSIPQRGGGEKKKRKREFHLTKTSKARGRIKKDGCLFKGEGKKKRKTAGSFFPA